MRDWGDIADAGNYETHTLQGADSGFPSSSRPLYENVDMTHSCVNTTPPGLFCGTLGCEGRSLAGALEPHYASTGGRYHISLGIGDTDQGIVKSGINVGPALRDGTPFSASGSGSGHQLHHLLLSAGTPTATCHGPSRALSRPSVGPGPLPADGQISTVPKTSIRPNVH